jgi:hypothetical protein
MKENYTMANHKAGGGIQSNKLVRPGMRAGAPARGVNAGNAGQIGSAIGTHSDKGDLRPKPEPMLTKSPHSVKLGNEVALNVGKGGPGAGRNLHGQSGTNRQYGPANPGLPEPQARGLDVRGRGPKQI